MMVELTLVCNFAPPPSRILTTALSIGHYSRYSTKNRKKEEMEEK